MRILLAASMLAAAVLSGCASVPMAPPEADASAKRFEVKPGMSNIYLIRHETYGGAIPMTVSLDGKVAGKTGPKTFFLWEVAPGQHEIASHTENTARITIDAKPGRNHFVWQEVKMGMWQPRSLLHEMSDADGRKAVLECSRASGGE